MAADRTDVAYVSRCSCDQSAHLVVFVLLFWQCVVCCSDPALEPQLRPDFPSQELLYGRVRRHSFGWRHQNLIVCCWHPSPAASIIGYMFGSWMHQFVRDPKLLQTAERTPHYLSVRRVRSPGCLFRVCVALL